MRKRGYEDPFERLKDRGILQVCQKSLVAGACALWRSKEGC
jgi:hypothetical protein